MKSRMIGANGQARHLSSGGFVLVLAISTFGQGRTPTAPPLGGGSPGSNAKRVEHVRRASEARLRSAEMEAGAEAENQRHIQEALTHMKQDFTRIQVLRNDIARGLVAHKPLDYTLITAQTGEISRRTHRLNVYMLAHAPEGKEFKDHAEIKSDEMIGALVRLCKLIDSFTENPALKNAALVDSKEIGKAKEDKARADKDLLAIIKLSDKIHKMSENLRDHKGGK